MFRLAELTPKDIGGGINLIDIGASGTSVPCYWKKLSHLTNLIGFDPNEEECHQLNIKDSAFLSQKFLPYAIAGENKKFTLYKTRNKYCWSLLEPNLPWLRRVAFSDCFEIEGKEQVSACTLGDVKDLVDVEIDVIKLDTQGLELPILKGAEKIVRDCILVETETGFNENYLGESTFDQVAYYMRSLGFCLFDINPNHRIPRKNKFSQESIREQMLWCEAIWMRDFCVTEQDKYLEVSREKALKALCIHANHGCYSFGLEAARKFHELGVLSTEEYQELASSKSSWKLHRSKDLGRRRILEDIINLIPRRYCNILLEILQDRSEFA